MVEQIAHPHSTLSLWDQGYLAGLCDARILINQIWGETGPSKAIILKYTSSNLERPVQITTATSGRRGQKWNIAGSY